MPNYRVTFEIVMDIEADNEEEALSKAYDSVSSDDIGYSSIEEMD